MPLEAITRSTNDPSGNGSGRAVERPLVADSGASKERGGAAIPGAAPFRGSVQVQKVEAIFVVLTFVGMVIGLLADWLGWSSGIRWFAYGVAYFFGGWSGVRGGIAAIRRFRVDIDLLMILAALGALTIGALFEGAMLLFLFSLSNVLQHYAIGRSRSAIRALMKLRPESARIFKDGDWVDTHIGNVAVGDQFLVLPGDRLPLDGMVLRGDSTVDQSSLTGESVPISKHEGDAVFGGTINGGGTLEVRVTKRSDESAIARLIQMVEEAQSEKAETQRLIDRLEQPYVLGVLGVTFLAITLPFLVFGQEFEPVFYRAMTLMVAASPCALIISTPAAVLSAIAAAARSGVLFKGGVYVEELATVRVIAFDKTGTLTEGRSRLTDLVVLAADLNEDELLSLAASVQARSEHHIADATKLEAKARDLSTTSVVGFQAIAGMGVSGEVSGMRLLIGNERLFAEYEIENQEKAAGAVADLKKKARTAVVIAQEEEDRKIRVLGVAGFADQLRQSAAGVIRDLKANGVERVEMITGDNAEVATVIAAEAGIDSFHSDVLPGEKVERVKQLRQQYGAIAFVGDGINDAPALAAATVGIAMGGAGTDVALETADLVLMADDLTRLPYAMELSRKTRRTLIANLSFSLGMIALMVGFILTVGLPLPLAVVGHEGSTVLVSLNGLRLLSFRPR